MADSTIDSERFYLLDRWPAGRVFYRLPTGGILGATHHNVATPAYDLGDRIMVRNTTSAGVAGWSTFIYLKLEMQDTTNVLAVKEVVAQHSDAAAGGAGVFDATNEVATLNGTQKGPAAVALSAMTVDYYGWFWCGGVCPESIVAGLGGTYATTGAVAIGDMSWGNLASASATVGEIGFDVANAAGETVIGVAMDTDVA